MGHVEDYINWSGADFIRRSSSCISLSASKSRLAEEIREIHAGAEHTVTHSIVVI